MNDPRLGFGWNDVAFSGSRPPGAHDVDHEVEVDGRQQGRGDPAAASPARGPRRPSGDSRSATGRVGQAGEQQLVDELHHRACRPARRAGPWPSAWPSVSTRVSGAERRHGLGLRR